MNRPRVQKKGLQVLAWLAVVVLSAVVALAQSSSAQRTDGQIEMDVVHALDASAQLKNDLITAATIQSEVTLSGTVASADSRQLAESIVAKVNGVTKVHNNLKVGDPQAAGEAMNLQNVPEDAASDASSANQSPAQNDQNAAPMQSNAPAAATYPAQAQEQYPAQAPYAGQEQYPQQASYPAQEQYPPQGQYPPPYPADRPQYAPQGYGQQQQQIVYRQAPGPLTLPQGTLLSLRTSEPVASKHAKDGQAVQFVALADVSVGEFTAIPRGAIFHGVVTAVKNTKSGDLGGNSELALQLTSLDLGGKSYPIVSDEFRVKGPSKAGRTAGSAITGALFGAIIGGAAGGGAGAAIGAGAGAGVGTAASAATVGPGVWIPAEARVDFHLGAPVTIAPVSAQEAARLGQGLYQGGPHLYQRPVYGRPVYGYPYAYPPVYYRPYYVVGGYYYWR